MKLSEGGRWDAGMGVGTWSIVAQELAAHYLYLHFHLMHFIFSFTVTGVQELMRD